MRRRVVVCLFIFLSTPFVHAQEIDNDINAEYTHQAEAGKFETTASYLGTFGTFNFNKHGYNGTLTDTPATLAEEYGFNAKLSLGVSLQYESATDNLSCPSGTTCGSPTSQGLANPDVYLRLKIPLGLGMFKIGADLRLTLTNATSDASGNSNADTGGNRLTPYLAYEYPAWMGIVGVKVAYDALKTDRKVKSTQADGSVINNTDTGGNTLFADLFYEANIDKITYGVALEYETSQDSKTSIDGASPKSNNNGYNAVDVEVYLPIHASPTFVVQPMLMSGVLNYTSSSYAVSSVNLFGAGIAIRLSL